MFIDEPLIKKVISSELIRLLHGKVSLLESINYVDKMIHIEESVLIPDMHT